MKQPILTTERMILRPFELSDANDVQRLAGAREIADTTLTIPHPYEDGMAEEWIKTHKPQFELGKLVNFALTGIEGGLLMGAIGLTINKTHNNAEMGYWVGKPFWNGGYCTEAAAAVMQYAFSELELNRVFANYVSRNSASGRIMEKIGMKYEGMMPKHVLNNGVYEDLILYGIVRSDWEK